MARIDNLSLSHRVTNDLGKAIVRGDYSIDARLPTEANLCNEYGISRTAVREAVKMLTAKGLISSRPRQGIRVEPPENWNLYDTNVLKWMLDSCPPLPVLKEFLQMRLAIEPQAAALAAKKADQVAIAQIEQAMKTMDQGITDPKGAFYEGELAFHTAILLASGNRFFCQLRDFISTAFNVSIQHIPPAKESLQERADNRRKVYIAIKNGDVERAKNMMAYVIDEATVFIEMKIAIAQD